VIDYLGDTDLVAESLTPDAGLNKMLKDDTEDTRKLIKATLSPELEIEANDLAKQMAEQLVDKLELTAGYSIVSPKYLSEILVDQRKQIAKEILHPPIVVEYDGVGKPIVVY